MSVVDPGLDPEIAQEIRTVLTEYVDKKLNDHDTRVERRMKELSARGPGALTGVSGGSTTCVAMPLLGGDSKFRDWLGTGRGRMARYSANFANFRIEQKAAGLVLSPALPTNVPGISGPAELSLRLVELLPSVNLTSGGSVEYVKESGFTPNADLQVEGEVKARSRTLRSRLQRRAYEPSPLPSRRHCRRSRTRPPCLNGSMRGCATAFN
jgi:hypothetical protein